jgi:F-type H+-transporting ATPase subunit delta
VVNRTLARRYAIAAIGVAEERGAVKRVGADLAAVAQAIGPHGLVHDFFVAPVIERREKERVLTQAFENRIDPVALHTLLLLVRKRREALLGAIVEEYLALERAARGAETMDLESARALDAAEYRDLIERLERLYDKKFEVTQRVNADLIGGLRLLIGDRRIDATVAGRLDAIARQLHTTAGSL